MKRYLITVLAVALSVSMFGCGKKQASFEEQEPLSMETLSTLNTNQTVAEVKMIDAASPVPPASIKLESLPPSGPYKPTGLEIQTALKNAGFYAGELDGKIGPMSRKAVGEFQKANGLQADGKVGPKTWAALSKFLNPAVSEAAPSSRKKR